MTFAPVHVLFRGPHWSVEVEHESLPRSEHVTQEAATLAARNLAAQMGTDLVVHDMAGVIFKRLSYRTGSL